MDTCLFIKVLNPDLVIGDTDIGRLVAIAFDTCQSLRDHFYVVVSLIGLITANLR